MAKFQSTRPVWGATHRYAVPIVRCRFQSTRPVWGATKAAKITHDLQMISIHAPRVGRDE